MRSRVLLAAVLSTCAGAAFAADLPIVRKAPPRVEAPYAGGFYIGIKGGGATTTTDNEVAISGVVTGQPKFHPAGFLAAGTIGYGTNAWLSGVYTGIEADIGGDFVHGGVGCSAINGMVTGQQCLGEAKTSFYSAQKILIGLPGLLFPNTTLAIEGGVHERNIKLCAPSVTDVLTGVATQQCASKIVAGPLAGVQWQIPFTPQWSAVVEYYHVFDRYSFTPTEALPIFANTVAVRDEDKITIGGLYRLPLN